MSNVTENFMYRVTQALSRPIQTRCAELTVLIDKGSIKDAHSIFPIIIDNIFGPQSSFSWDLQTITQAQNFQDFQALQHFLSPHGPIFRLIYTLLKDPQIKYEFSLSYLPTKLRQCFEVFFSDPFYTEIMNVNPITKEIISLILNPFDYYFFHFAYHLINPWHQRLPSIPNTSFNNGSVYFNLCCDYMMHFLPTDPNSVVLPIIDYYVEKNPLQNFPTFVRPVRISKLFRPSILVDTINEMNSVSQTPERHPRNHIWRSETVLKVLVDMWLYNDQVVHYEQTFPLNKQQFHYHELPTAEYIRIVRVLVKKLHAFYSSAKADDTNMTELKKIAVPYMQGKMYVFLRNLIHRWPLDGSFRLVLELWLSFIQPWRYQGDNFLKPKSSNDAQIEQDLCGRNSKIIENDHFNFILENFLAYVVIFQQLLPRFIKVDLSSPKIALMLYRMLKVMSQSNLVELLKEVEKSLENMSNSPSHAHWRYNLPPLSPTSTWCSTDSFSVSNMLNSSSFLDSSQGYRGSKWSNVVKHKLAELESQNFCYKPMFTSEVAQEVVELAWHIKNAQQVANTVIRARKEEEQRSYRGFLGFIRMVFAQPEFSNDEFSIEERSKVPVMLNLSLEFLFKIFPSVNVNPGLTSKDESISTSGILSSQMNNNDFPFLLTPEKVRERLKYLKFEGDPDLHPVRSDENKFLVRVLYQVSKKLNEEFGHHIRRLYYMDSFCGKVCREVVCPPLTIYKYEKSDVGHSPLIEEHLPPRITLRPLASHKFLIYAFLGVLLNYFFGYGIFPLFLFVFLTWSSFVFVKVLIPKRQQTNRDSPERVLNLSLNDSFN